MNWLKIALVVVLVCATPPAMWYCMNYDRYGSIGTARDPVFIQICTVGTPNFNNILRIAGVEYGRKNKGVKIIVVPLSEEQANGMDFDIKIVGNFAFISAHQSPTAISHCKKFLNNLVIPPEYKLIWKES